MNVGLIGLGKMGKIHYRVLQELRKENKVNDILVYDIGPTEVPKVTFKKLFKKSDCIIVAVPTIKHIEYVDICLSEGIPVFCEKPFSDNYTKEELYYEKWAGLRNPEKRPLLFIGYIERYNAILRRFDLIINKIKRDPDDTILYVNTRRVNCVKPEVVEGREIITDLGVHDFDMLLNLFGVLKLQSSRIITSKGKAVFAQSLFEVGDGVFCDSIISWIDVYKRREYTVYTKKKVISVDLLKQEMIVLNRMNNKKDIFVERIEPAYVEINRFLRMVKEYSPINVMDPLGLKAQKMSIDILQNAEVIDV